MSDTTSIFELPSDPSIGGNITMNIQDKNLVVQQPMMHSPSPPPPQSQGQPSVSLDQTTINQIVNGLQQASSTGATLLPSRDIPATTQHITHDPQIQTNYIPPPVSTRSSRYIDEEETQEKIVDEYNQKQKKSNALDQVYDEIQTPLLIGVLFFLFQLPVFKRFLFTYFPVLFFKDGNINIYGYTFQSFLFGLVYYLVFKVMNHFGKF
jgi:hypothetical protein